MSHPSWFGRNYDLVAVTLLTLVVGAVSSVASFVQVHVGRAPMKIEEIKREARQAIREAADEIQRESRHQAVEVHDITDQIRREKVQFHREVRSEAECGITELRKGLREFSAEIRRGRDDVRRGVQDVHRDLGRELRQIRID